MSGGSQSTNTVQNADPWSGAQPYLKDVMSQAQGLFRQGSQYAPFSTVTPYSPVTQQALGLTQQRALNGSPVSSAANSAVTDILGGSAFNGNPANSTLLNIANGSTLNSNPYIDQNFNAAARGVADNVNAVFGGAGRGGSGTNQDFLGKNLSDLAANMYGQNFTNQQQAQQQALSQLSQNYTTGQQQELQGAALSPSLAGQDYTDLQNLLSVGGAYDSQAQQYTQDALNRWNFTQQQPWQNLANYSSAVSGLGLGAYGTKNTTETQPGQSLLPTLIGGGLGLLAAPFTGGTSLLGTIFGSDRRMKHDIHRIGTSKNGLPLYRFKYKGEHVERIGLMADDVEKVAPGAVIDTALGLKMVNYSMALAA